MTRPCEVRGCSGTLHAYNTVNQKGTGDRLHQFECDVNWRHRAWLIESLDQLHKTQPTRWDTSKL
jgi:hypothetical protein